MDSFTQALLGSAIAESVIGKQVGRKASLWGAFLGVLPDLDFVVRYSNPVDSFTYHRSYSHSLLVFIALVPLLVWLIRKLHPASAQQTAAWTAVVTLCLVTHVLLDTLTIYGTQLLWPLSEYPFGIGSVFIIDPLYSLPLLIGCIAVLLTRGATARRILQAGLVLSTVYLLWGLLAQHIMHNRIQQHLDELAPGIHRVTLTPAPFNSLLWRFIVRVEGGYYEGFMSFFDAPGKPAMQFHASRDELIPGLQNMPSAARLMWFSKGQFSITQQQDSIIISDLRMGVEPDYVFTFKVAERVQGQLVEVAPQHINNRNVTRQKLDWIYQRISDSSLPLPVGNFAR